MIPPSDFADDGCNGKDGQLLEVQIYTDDYAEDTSFTVTDQTIHPGNNEATDAVLLEASNLQYNNKRYKVGAVPMQFVMQDCFVDPSFLFSYRIS